MVMGGLVADGPVGVEDIQAVIGDLAALPFAALRIRPNPRVGALWSRLLSVRRSGYREGLTSYLCRDPSKRSAPSC